MRRSQKLAPNSPEPQTDEPLESRVTTKPVLRETKSSVCPVSGSPIIEIHRTCMQRLTTAFPAWVRLEEKDRGLNLQLTAVLKYDPSTTFRDEVAAHIHAHPDRYPPGSLPQLLLKMIEFRPPPTLTTAEKKKAKKHAGMGPFTKPRRPPWNAPDVIAVEEEPDDYPV